MELSPQLQKMIREQLEQAKTQLEAQKEELKNQPGNDEAKTEIAEKLGLVGTLLLKYELGVLPSPKEALALFERLEANVDLLTRLLKKLIEAVKVIVQGIIDILKILIDGIRSLFPKEETRTAFLPDGELKSQEVVTFGLLSQEGAEGLLTVPAAFAGTPGDLVVPYTPCRSTFSVRVRPVSPSMACLCIESLASTSRPIEREGVRLPAFLQSLDPRVPSMGMLDLETGELEGRVYTQLTDGQLYTVKSPILVRSAFTGRMHFDAGILRLQTRALDFAGDEPLRRALRGEPC
jgi:hypothetical protein